MSTNINYLIKETLVIVPCYNAKKTIIQTLDEILKTGFNEVLISDDFSSDGTYHIVKSKYPNIRIINQKYNLGYGGNQKFLYEYAINHNYKYVIMIHGDFQYTPKLIPSMIYMLSSAEYDFVFGSRILGGDAIKNGMPIIKYFANRVLTLFQNLCTGYKLSEYHSGLRAFKVSAIKEINLRKLSDDFFFDNQIIIELMKRGLNIGEVSCTTKYDTNSSSISYKDSVLYGINVIGLSFVFIVFRFFKNINT